MADIDLSVVPGTFQQLLHHGNAALQQRDIALRGKIELIDHLLHLAAQARRKEFRRCLLYLEHNDQIEHRTDENAALLAKLLSNPETAALLKALAKTI